MELKPITITRHIQFIDIEDYDEEVEEALDRGFDTEMLVFELENNKEVQLLLLRYIGYTSNEITKIMNLRNRNDYYIIWRKLREDVKKIKNL